MRSPCEKRDRCHPVAAAAKVWRLSLIAFLAALYACAGCSGRAERIHALNAEAVIDELSRVEKKLPSDQAGAFKQAYQVLLAQTVLEAQGNESQASVAIMRRFNGKTAKEVIADFDRLDPSSRLMLTTGIAGAKKKSEDLRATNEKRAKEESSER